MYTLEEIEERGKLHFQMTVVKWIIVTPCLAPCDGLECCGWEWRAAFLTKVAAPRSNSHTG